MDIQQLVKELQDVRLYPDRPDKIELTQTHISLVFISRTEVYKVKKPVDFGFLDFTSLEKRRHFCEEEVRLNRRLSPEVYLGLQPIYLKGGSLSFSGPGEIVEYAVRMRRLPLERQMKRLLGAGTLTDNHVVRLAAKLAAFHREAATGGEIDSYGTVAIVKKNTDENFAQTEKYIGEVISASQFNALKSYTDAFLETRAPLLTARIKAGKIRDCHGDLHMEHILLTEQEIVIFDCIEFTPRFRYSDTAADLAFLTMDLDYHGAFDLSARLLDHYKEASGDRELDEVLKFYQVYRAYVRGKVTAFQLDDPLISPEAKAKAQAVAARYFRLAYSYIMPIQPLWLGVGGVMGVGKSTLAALAGNRWGMELILTDEVRKELAGISRQEHRFVGYGQDIYTPEFSRKTYAEVFRRAAKAAASGRSAIIDASFKEAALRREAAQAAKNSGANFILCLCHAPESVIRERLAQRAKQAEAVSDGRLEILPQQIKDFALPEATPEVKIKTIDTAKPLQGSLEELLHLLAAEAV